MKASLLLLADDRLPRSLGMIAQSSDCEVSRPWHSVRAVEFAPRLSFD